MMYHIVIGATFFLMNDFQIVLRLQAIVIVNIPFN